MATHDDVVRALQSAQYNGWTVTEHDDYTEAQRGEESVIFQREGQRYFVASVGGYAVSFEAALLRLREPVAKLSDTGFAIEAGEQLPVAADEVPAEAKPRKRRATRSTAPIEADTMVSEGSPVDGDTDE